MLFITGIGTDSKKLDSLSIALNNIVKSLPSQKMKKNEDLKTILPVMKYTPREAYQLPKKSVDKNNCAGCICGEYIMKYPPGIPVLLPGEIIQKQHLQHINKSKIQII